jgi:hypothetical protein
VYFDGIVPLGSKWAPWASKGEGAQAAAVSKISANLVGVEFFIDDSWANNGERNRCHRTNNVDAGG